jgi:hypothetical protein
MTAPRRRFGLRLVGLRRATSSTFPPPTLAGVSGVSAGVARVLEVRPAPSRLGRCGLPRARPPGSSSGLQGRCPVRRAAAAAAHPSSKVRASSCVRGAAPGSALRAVDRVRSVPSRVSALRAVSVGRLPLMGLSRWSRSRGVPLQRPQRVRPLGRSGWPPGLRPRRVSPPPEGGARRAGRGAAMLRACVPPAPFLTTSAGSPDPVRRVGLRRTALRCAPAPTRRSTHRRSSRSWGSPGFPPAPSVRPPLGGGASRHLSARPVAGLFPPARMPLEAFTLPVTSAHPRGSLSPPPRRVSPSGPQRRLPLRFTRSPAPLAVVPPPVRSPPRSSLHVRVAVAAPSASLDLRVRPGAWTGLDPGVAAWVAPDAPWACADAWSGPFTSSGAAAPTPGPKDLDAGPPLAETRDGHDPVAVPALADAALTPREGRPRLGPVAPPREDRLGPLGGQGFDSTPEALVLECRGATPPGRLCPVARSPLGGPARGIPEGPPDGALWLAPTSLTVPLRSIDPRFGTGAPGDVRSRLACLPACSISLRRRPLCRPPGSPRADRQPAIALSGPPRQARAPAASRLLRLRNTAPRARSNRVGGWDTARTSRLAVALRSAPPGLPVGLAAAVVGGCGLVRPRHPGQWFMSRAGAPAPRHRPRPCSPSPRPGGHDAALRLDRAAEEEARPPRPARTGLSRTLWLSVRRPLHPAVREPDRVWAPPTSRGW